MRDGHVFGTTIECSFDYYTLAQIANLPAYLHDDKRAGWPGVYPLTLVGTSL